MRSDSHTHSPSHSQLSVKTTCSVLPPAALARVVDLWTPEDEGRFVSLKTVSLEEYTKEVIFVFIGHLLNVKRRLQNIEKQH